MKKVGKECEKARSHWWTFWILLDPFRPFKIDLFSLRDSLTHLSSRPGPEGAANAPKGDEEKLQPHLGSAPRRHVRTSLLPKKEVHYVTVTERFGTESVGCNYQTTSLIA